MYPRVIYWFKRDLRIEDNRAFSEACLKAKQIIPVFIFIPELLAKFKSYDRRPGFIIDALAFLNKKIEAKGGRLYCFYDQPERVFIYLLERYRPQAIFTNRAFSYSGEKSESKVMEICRKRGVEYKAYNDNFLAQIERIPYRKVYTYFYRKWKENLNLQTSSSPEKINTPLINEPQLEAILPKLKYQENSYWKADFFLARLKEFDFKKYEQSRNRLDTDGTSKLSPYIRFGLVSLREIYREALRAVGEDCQFIKELAWREFMRIFNPMIQAEKFDPDGIFIKKYLPELKNLPPYMLHNPLKFDLPYYKPIVNHYAQVLRIKHIYLK